MRQPAKLVLADGRVFEGEAIGTGKATVGECVFTTGMTGYQEVLSDPSYAGQIVTMTAPQMGNTGVNDEDDETVKPFVAGFVVHELSTVVSNWRASRTLDEYLKGHGIAGITGVDTRSLTRHIRNTGAQIGVIGTEDVNVLLERARTAPSMEGLNLADGVSTKKTYECTQGSGVWGNSSSLARARARVDKPGASPRHIVAIDYGVKQNILRSLIDTGSKVTVVPSTTSADDILALQPDGVFLSNGPGDPAAVDHALPTIRTLIQKKPVFGICLGHQLLALAVGAKTYKLKFGHRGLNQPVKDLSTGRIEITTQNHGFAVDVPSTEGKAVTSHIHLNDGTCQGIEHPETGAFSVQYHPEAAAGPHDSRYLFERFVERIDARR